MELLGALVILPALTAGLVCDLPPERCLWCMTSSCGNVGISYQSIKTMSPLSMEHCAVDQYICMSRGSFMWLSRAWADCSKQVMMTIKHANKWLVTSNCHFNAMFHPSQASSEYSWLKHCIEVTIGSAKLLLPCLIVQNNHPTINSSMPNNFHA